MITRPHLRRVLHELNVGVEHDEDPGPAAAVLAVDHGRAAQLRPGEGVGHHAAEVELELECTCSLITKFAVFG